MIKEFEMDASGENIGVGRRAPRHLLQSSHSPHTLLAVKSLSGMCLLQIFAAVSTEESSE